MCDFFNEGAFTGSAPAPVGGGKDLGEKGGSGVVVGGGYVPEASTTILPAESTATPYWGRSSGVISPSTLGDVVAIGRATAAHSAKLSVEGTIYALGFILSGDVRITKDSSDNMVFIDPVSGSKTLAELLAVGGGDVVASGTPVADQLAVWTDNTTIKGVDASSLMFAIGQIITLEYELANRANLTHSLIDTARHPVAGLTGGHFLKALTPTTYGFAAHGLTKTDIGLANVTNDAQVKKIASATSLAIARWDGTTGALLKNSPSTLADDGSINIPTGAKYKINGVPISLYGGVSPFHVQAFANPLALGGATYKDFICASITSDTVINLTGTIDGDAGMIVFTISDLLLTDESSNIITDEDDEEIQIDTSVTLGTMFTKQLGATDIDNTAGAENVISWRHVGTDIYYTINQVV